MKRLFFTLISLIIICIFTNAQNISPMAYSEKVPCMEGVSKVKMLKNGNTALLHFKHGEGVFLTLFNKEKKKITEGNVPTTVLPKRLGTYQVASIYDINSDLLVLVSAYLNNKVTLVRLIFDGTTGKLKKEDLLLAMPEIKGGAGYALTFGGIPAPNFYVEKDPKSDHYAIVVFNSLAEETNKRMELVHYSPSHQEINRAFFISPRNEFKYLNYLTMYVKGDQYVVLGSYVFNTKASGGDKAVVYISKLAKGTTSFVNKEVPYTDSFTRSDCDFVYDNATGNFNALLKNKVESNGKGTYYEILIQPVNPDKFELGKSYSLTLENANKYFQTKIGSKDPYQGMPQHYVVDQTGNSLFLNEQAIVLRNEYGAGTRLYDIAITSLGKDGKEKYGFVIPYYHTSAGATDFLSYYRFKNGVMTSLTMDIFYGSTLDLIPGRNFNYVFLNNSVANLERSEADRKYDVAKEGGTFNSYYYKIDNKTGAFTKDYLFGKPATKDDNKYCLFQTSDFNQETGNYASVIIEKVKGKKMMSVVWISLN